MSKENLNPSNSMGLNLTNPLPLKLNQKLFKTPEI